MHKLITILKDFTLPAGMTCGLAGFLAFHYVRWLAPVKPAAQAAAEAMRGGQYPTEERLWPYNVKYNTTQAADFAYIVATAINAVDCSADEMDYEFRKGIVFNDKAMTNMNRNWNADMPVGDALALVGKVAVGAVTGKIRPKTVGLLLRGIWYATLLKSHYKKFPHDIARYSRWAQRCDKLWEKTGNMADVTERCEARMKNAGN